MTQVQHMSNVGARYTTDSWNKELTHSWLWSHTGKEAGYAWEEDLSLVDAAIKEEVERRACTSPWL